MKSFDVAAVVSGGASGLGEATVRELVARGAAVTILDLQEDRGSALAGELGGHTTFVRTDVTDEAQVQAAIDDATGKDRPLRIAVNCAGIGWAQRTVGRDNKPHDLEPFVKTVMVNLVGTFNVLRLAAAAMAATEPLEDGERGVVVNTASIAAFDGQIGQIAYSASQGRHRRHDAAGRARPVQRRRPRLHDRARAWSTPRCWAACPRRPARRSPRASRSRSASAAPRTSPSSRSTSSSTATSTARSSGWTARCAWRPADDRP